MLDKLKITIKDSLIYSLGNISTKIIGLILLPLYLKELSVEEYGMLGILEITLQIFVALFSFSVYQAFYRWYWDKKYRNKQQSLFFTSLFFNTSSAIIMVLIFFLFAEKISIILLDSTKYKYLLRLMLISAGLQLITMIPLFLMRLQRKAIFFATSNILKLIVTLSFTIYFIVYQGKKLDGIFEAQIIGFIFLIIITSKFIIQNIRLKLELFALKEMLKYSYPLMLSTIGGLMLNMADRYFIRYLEGLNSMGVYNLGFKVVNVLKIVFIQSAFSAINPLRFKLMNNPDHKRFYSKIMTYTVFGFLIFQMILMFFSKELLFLLSENKPQWGTLQVIGALQIIPVLCYAKLFEIFRLNVIIGLKIRKKTQIISTIMIVASVINILLNYFFISLFGTIGAAIASLVAQILFFILIYYYAQKHYRLHYEITKVLKMTGVSVVLTIIAYNINSVILIPRIFIKGSLILSFPFLLYFLGVYEQIELTRIREAWRKWKNPRNWGKNLKKIKIK